MPATRTSVSTTQRLSKPESDCLVFLFTIEAVRGVVTCKSISFPRMRERVVSSG